MIRRVGLLLTLAAGLTLAGCASTTDRTTASSNAPLEGVEVKGSIPADQALARMEAGNLRFASGRPTHPNISVERILQTGIQGQFPYASVLTCADSRIPAERVFDKGVGDLFVVRVAGNVTGPLETASLEFGVAALGTNLLVVMGHTKCGAVAAVASDAELFGSLPQLAQKIQPAVRQARSAHPGVSVEELTEHAVAANVNTTIAELFRTSPALADAARAGTLKVVGAVYDLETGRVNFTGEHPEQDRLLGS